MAALATLVLRSLPRRPKYHKPATALEKFGATVRDGLLCPLPALLHLPALADMRQ